MMIIGIIYRIDYIGNDPVIKGCKYAGSKKNLKNWDTYFGSPSTKNCIKCATWRQLSKTAPHDFKKTIIYEVKEGESIIEKEVEYLKSVVLNIRKDDAWLNTAIPRQGAFPEFSFTEEQLHEREIKRKQTTLATTGYEYGFLDIDKRRSTCMKRYGVSNYNKLESQKQKNSLHKADFFSKMSKEERLIHGAKSLKGRDEKNVMLGTLKSKVTRSSWSDIKRQEVEQKRYEKWRSTYYARTEKEKSQTSVKCKIASTLIRKQYFITLYNHDTGATESKFLKEWLLFGYARDGLMHRIKNNSQQPLYSRKIKQTVTIIKVEKISPISI